MESAAGSCTYRQWVCRRFHPRVCVCVTGLVSLCTCCHVERVRSCVCVMKPEHSHAASLTAMLWHRFSLHFVVDSTPRLSARLLAVVPVSPALFPLPSFSVHVLPFSFFPLSLCHLSCSSSSPFLSSLPKLLSDPSSLFPSVFSIPLST